MGLGGEWSGVYAGEGERCCGGKDVSRQAFVDYSDFYLAYSHGSEDIVRGDGFYSFVIPPITVEETIFKLLNFFIFIIISMYSNLPSRPHRHR